MIASQSSEQNDEKEKTYTDTEGNIDIKSLDFSGDNISDEQPQSPQLGEAYDPRPHEDGARRVIAYLLIGLLFLTVIGMFIELSFGIIAVTDIKEFSVVLGPIVTLVSAATGFYYGTKSNSTPTLSK